MTEGKDFFVVVDVETTGPNPGTYSLLSIGACTIGDPQQTFYIELKPDRPGSTLEASSIHKLSLDSLRKLGIAPKEAMESFANWLDSVIPVGKTPVFTAFNTPFDWMFINVYFHRYFGGNPFGHKALDIKALYMGVINTNWESTSYIDISRHYGVEPMLSHHALEDALQSAELLKLIINDMNRRNI